VDTSQRDLLGGTIQLSLVVLVPAMYRCRNLILSSITAAPEFCSKLLSDDP